MNKALKVKASRGIVYRTERVIDPFVLKFISPIQNNIGPNFCDGLNFVTCEQAFKAFVIF